MGRLKVLVALEKDLSPSPMYGAPPVASLGTVLMCICLHMERNTQRHKSEFF